VNAEKNWVTRRNAALGYDGHATFVADGEDGGHFRGVRGPHHDVGAPLPAPRPIGLIAGDRLGIGENMPARDDPGEVVDDGDSRVSGARKIVIMNLTFRDRVR
jgi:hypothetical protein